MDEQLKKYLQETLVQKAKNKAKQKARTAALSILSKEYRPRYRDLYTKFEEDYLKEELEGIEPILEDEEKLALVLVQKGG